MTDPKKAFYVVSHCSNSWGRHQYYCREYPNTTAAYSKATRFTNPEQAHKETRQYADAADYNGIFHVSIVNDGASTIISPTPVAVKAPK
jgi:hypothetical protein